MMTQSRHDETTHSRHRKMGVTRHPARQPPSCDGGYYRCMVFAFCVLLLLSNTANAQPDDQPAVELSPLVKALLDDDLLTDAQRREAMIFHGQWDELGELTPVEELRLAVDQYRVDENTVSTLDRKIPSLPADNGGLTEYALLAEAAHKAGRASEALSLFGEMDIQFHGVERLRVARVFEELGDYESAQAFLSLPRHEIQKGVEKLKTAEDLTAGAQAVLMLARLEGRPAADFHLANKLLSRAHEEVDPLYWPAYVAEAELLFAKGNPQQAMEAVGQALSLNPKSSEAWYLFGSMRCRFFDFDAASRAVKELHAINKEHPLADVLAVEIALRQKDIATAKAVIEPALERYPTHRKLLALSAAVRAMAYDEAATQQALATFAKLAPGNPLAEYAVGQALSDARQYKLAEPHLKRAIKMMPGWSEPQLTLGELYVQWGKLQDAAGQLQTAASLDPFHKEITNQLTLTSEMLSYATITTDQFVVRYLPGVDEVLARDVALHMGEMAEQFIDRFKHDPPAMTQVDLMPDDQHFAVRVTGLPDIWTIAACTGDVIAMTPPRPGPKRAYGAYNWLNVMGHEYAHVVNLSQTDNRVPHWFTEGCAVQMETTGRLWSQYQLLAKCYNNDKLFEYDQINWGFIRPTEPYHRSLAYAQSAWIMQYIETTFGWDKALKMLDLYKQGTGEHDTIQQVFGNDAKTFMDSFMDWAGEQVTAWGMATYAVDVDDPALMKLMALNDAIDIDHDALIKAMDEHPDEPYLYRLMADRMIRNGDLEAGIEMIKLYQSKRPVDPWADRQLARLALESGDADTAIAALTTLDKIEGDAPEYAVELARVYRSRKAYDKALHFAERALLREPYNATFREKAATIAIQQGNLSRAAFHVESLALLEPERVIHPKRLVVIYERLKQKEDANRARQRVQALELLDND